MNVVFYGPWYGEFGWELMCWQAWCRKDSKKYDKVYMSSFPDMEALYADFIDEFIPHQHHGRALDWRSLEGIEYTMPGDVTHHVKPFKRFMRHDDNQEFIKYGKEMLAESPKYLIHPRNLAKGVNKNYHPEMWEDIVNGLDGPVASVGREPDWHIKGTLDLRGIALENLMGYISECECVIGQSSGVMHLATLCGAKIVVWADDRTYFSRTLDERYSDIWNPFGTEVVYVSHPKWMPDPREVVQRVLGEGEEVMAEEKKTVKITAIGPSDEELRVATKVAPITVPEIAYTPMETPKETLEIDNTFPEETEPKISITTGPAPKPPVAPPKMEITAAKAPEQTSPDRVTTDEIWMAAGKELGVSPEELVAARAAIAEAKKKMGVPSGIETSLVSPPIETRPQVPQKPEPQLLVQPSIEFEGEDASGLEVSALMADTISRAMASHRWLITVSYMNPTKEGNILHSYQTNAFPNEELIPTLEHLKCDIYEKEVVPKKGKTVILPVEGGTVPQNIPLEQPAAPVPTQEDKPVLQIIDETQPDKISTPQPGQIQVPQIDDGEEDWV